MQMLHLFAGSIQHYLDQIADPNRYRPDHCPQCGAKRPLTGHGFYCRTLVDATFNGVLRIRRYLCCSCKRTVSLLPEFVLPWLRFSISVIALFLTARLLNGLTLAAAAQAAGQTAMPYQRGQFWIRRFQKQAPALSLALVPLEMPGHLRDPAANFVSRTLGMLESIGWIAAHRFLFSQLRVHLLGELACLVPAARRTTLASACPTQRSDQNTEWPRKSASLRSAQLKSGPMI